MAIRLEAVLISPFRSRSRPVTHGGHHGVQRDCDMLWQQRGGVRSSGEGAGACSFGLRANFFSLFEKEESANGAGTHAALPIAPA
jgi:hypothetical protein